MKRKNLFFSILAILALFMVSCGGNNQKQIDETSKNETIEAVEEQPTKPTESTYSDDKVDFVALVKTGSSEQIIREIKKYNGKIGWQTKHALVEKNNQIELANLLNNDGIFFIDDTEALFIKNASTENIISYVKKRGRNMSWQGKHALVEKNNQIELANLLNTDGIFFIDDTEALFIKKASKENVDKYVKKRGKHVSIEAKTEYEKRFKQTLQ